MKIYLFLKNIMKKYTARNSVRISPFGRGPVTYNEEYCRSYKNALLSAQLSFRIAKHTQKYIARVHNIILYVCGW